MQIISSQRYLDDAIIAAKAEQLADEPSVTLPVLAVGDEYEVPGLFVLADGHHTRAAAVELGLAIEYRVLARGEHDLATLSGDTLLTAAYHADEWYDVDTGATIF